MQLCRLAAAFALLFLFMMMGAPMAIALGASTVITLVCTTSLGITTIATACFSGLDSFPLLAVPFFILGGAPAARLPAFWG